MQKTIIALILVVSIFSINTVYAAPQIILRYNFSDDDIYLLAQLLCGDANYDGDGEYDFVRQIKKNAVNYVEISKVLGVVMNRVHSDEYPDTISEVVLQKGQFSTMPRNSKKIPSDAAIDVIEAWCVSYNDGDEDVRVVPDDHLYFCSGPNNTNVTRAEYR